MRLIDADALSEKLCKTTIFIKDGEVFQRMINDAPTVSEKHQLSVETPTNLSAEAIHKPDYSYEAGMVRRLKEALSAEATTGDYPNDLISRSALMEYCSNQKSKSIDNNDIARFPSAEAVQGEWVEEDEYSGLWVCDQCGFASEYMDNFCPNCGAKMKGGDSE